MRTPHALSAPMLATLAYRFLDSDPELAVELARLGVDRDAFAERAMRDAAIDSESLIFKTYEEELSFTTKAQEDLDDATDRVLQDRHDDCLRTSAIIAAAAIGTAAICQAAVNPAGLITAYIPPLLGLIVCALGAVLVRRQYQSLTRAMPTKLAEPKKIVIAAQTRTKLERSAVHTELLQGVIRPFARELRDALHGRSFSTSLEYVSAKGLSQSFNPRPSETSHPQLEEARRLIENMPGGAIGITGGRGSGKSTLLKLLRDSYGFKHDKAIVVSAPVRYDARDFVLHLIAKLCREELGLRSFLDLELRETAEGSAQDELSRFLSHRRLRFTVLIACSLIYVASAASIYADIRPLSINTLNVPFATRTLVLVALSVAATLCFMLVVLRGRDYRRIISRGGSRKIGTDEYNHDRLAQIMQTARSQRSVSAGDDRAINVGVAFGGVSLSRSATGKHNRTITDNSLSLPDTVDLFHETVTTMIGDGRVIIAIDEVDKLATAEAARDFLNDLKSIFGLPNVFFFVAVSNEALASFTRRGPNLKDVYDSAFDEVVDVNSMTYASSRAIIANRVVGLPEPFQALIYTLSQGNPRDAIRWSRRLIGKYDEGDELSRVASEFLCVEFGHRVKGLVDQLPSDIAVPNAVEKLVRDCIGATSIAAYESALFALREQKGPFMRDLDELILSLTALALEAAALQYLFNNSLSTKDLLVLRGSGPRNLDSLVHVVHSIHLSASERLEALERWCKDNSVVPHLLNR